MSARKRVRKNVDYQSNGDDVAESMSIDDQNCDINNYPNNYFIDTTDNTSKNTNADSMIADADCVNTTQSAYRSQIINHSQYAPDSDDDDEMRVNDTGDQNLSVSGLAECGTIKKIILDNFMCHKHFEIDFTPRVNFVIGRNGSGKSAIMAGIMIALGGRMSATQRGSSMTKLIKEGERSARVTLLLCNYNGYNENFSYKRNVYGDTIIIERILRVDGANTYALKSSNGRTISNLKRELDEILLHFGIQVANPVCMLSQDMSRNFLNSKNARDKFEFFMKATNLERLKMAYMEANENNADAKEKLDKKLSLIPEMEEDLKEYKRRIKRLTKYNEYQTRHFNAKLELLWSCVALHEKEKEEKITEINERDERINQGFTQIITFDNKVSLLKKKKEEQTVQVQHIVDEWNAKDAEFEQQKSRLQSVKDTLSQKRVAVEFAEQSLSREKRNENTLKVQIEQIKQKFVEYERLNAEKEQREQRKAELQNSIDQLTQSSTKHLENKQQLEAQRNTIQEELVNAKKTISRISTTKAAKEREIKNLQQAKGDTLRLFGDHIVEAVRRIEQLHKENKFTEKPCGPIGYHVKMKEKRLCLAAECIIKGNLTSFVCDNLKDRNLLENEFKRIFARGKHPSIIVRKFKSRFNIEQRAHMNEYRCILDYIDIRNDAIFNALIDVADLDTILVVPAADKARDLLIKGNVPSCCKSAISADGTQTFAATGESAFRQYVNDNRKHALYLTDDVTETIKQMSLDVKKCEEELVEADKVAQGFVNDIKDVTKQLHEAEQLYRNHIQRITPLKRELSELQSIRVEEPPEIAALEEDLEEIAKKISYLDEELKVKRQAYTEHLARLSEEQELLDKMKCELDAVFQKKFPLLEEIKKIEFDILKCITNQKKFEARLQDLQKRQEEERNKIHEIDERIETAITAAEDKHKERIVTNRTPEYLQNEIKALEECLKERDNEVVDVNELIAIYEDKHANLEKVISQSNLLKNYYEFFSKAITLRSKAYVDYRKHISKRVSFDFTSYLKMLNFSGNLNIYYNTKEDSEGQIHQEKTLEIKVNPKSSDLTSAYSDSRSLSGGERSFSTIAFLLSLWQFCTSPFNVLDEIDVFMDMVTRHLALDALIESANSELHRQYIFLSPLPPEKKNIREMLNIYYMPEPERK